MRRLSIVLFLFVLVTLSACNTGDDENEVLELTEKEKLSVSIERELKQVEDVYELTDSLTPQDTEDEDDNLTVEYYDPEEYNRFILPEGWVNEVRKTVETDDGETVLQFITIGYIYRNHQISIDYFEDGSVRKYLFDANRGLLFVNENNEEYAKYDTGEGGEE